MGVALGIEGIGRRPQSCRARCRTASSRARRPYRSGRSWSGRPWVVYCPGERVNVEMVLPDDWSKLFWAAFRQSRNPMVLLDDERTVVDVNGAFVMLVGYPPDEVIAQPGYRFVIGGPVLSPQEWAANLAVDHFTGETKLVCADGTTAFVQWGAQ